MLSSTFAALATQGLSSNNLRVAALKNFVGKSDQNWPANGCPDANTLDFWETLVQARRQFRLKTGSEIESLFGA